MAIYRSGTASLDASGKAVGTGTKWKEALSLIRIGATVIFLSGSKPVLGSIAEIISDTEMNLIGTGGQTAASGEYVILLSDSITVDGLAQDVAETLRYYQSQETNVADIVDFLNNTDLEAEIDKMQELINQSGDSAAEALASELKAKQWASEQEDTEVEPGLFSSYHYSRKSQESAAESEASNQASAASAAASEQSAQDSEASNQASAASAAAAKVSEDNAKASEEFVDVALAIAFRDRGVLTDQDLNDISTVEKQGLYGMPADTGATSDLHYPEEKAGTLMVTRGSFGGVVQTYIVAETSMAYARGLIAELNESKDGPWLAWKHIGFMSSSTPVESLDLARTPGRYVLNAASTGNPMAGTAATLEVIAYNSDNIRQDVSAAISSGANANRHFSRVGTFSGGAPTWGEWVEFVTVKTNGITNTIRGFQSQVGVFISESQLTANSQKRGGAVRSVYTAGGVDYAAKMEVIVKTDANKVATKSLLLGVEGGTGEIEILPDGTLFCPYKLQGKSIASIFGSSEFNITNEGSSTIQAYHTADITKINFNGLDIDAANISGFGVVAAKGDSPLPLPPEGSYISSPAVRSYLWGRGGNADPNGAFFGFYHQENVGNYARGVVNLNGYGIERNWIFWNNGQLDGPFGTIQASGSDVRLKYDIEPAKPGATERIESIGVVEYTEKGTNRRKRGFISQQVDTVDSLYTDMGGENFDENDEKYEILNINDRAIMADMIVTMQEMRKEMKKLQDEISKLKGE